MFKIRANNHPIQSNSNHNQQTQKNSISINRIPIEVTHWIKTTIIQFNLTKFNFNQTNQNHGHTIQSNSNQNQSFNSI